MTARAMVVDEDEHARQIQQTRQALDTIDDTSLVDLTHLAVGAVRALKEEVAEIFPASNLPAFLLQGLIQLDDRTLKHDRVAADLRVLFRGSKQIGIYGTFLAAPALVLYGYQRLLALAGKDIESAFPDGPWQFYTQFGLREDAARHSVETIGFQRAAPGASELDAATCWIYAAMRTLFAYDALLANEWEERMLPRTLDDLLADHAAALLGKRLPRKASEREKLIAERAAALRAEYRLERLAAGWAAIRPYRGPPDAPLGDYAAYRRTCFREYLGRALRHMPHELRQELDRRYAERRKADLPAYQQQLTLLTTLRAESYEEHRAPLPPQMLRVALVAGGRYYLLDACARDSEGRPLIFPIDGAPETPGVPLRFSRAEDGSLRDRYDRPIEFDRRGRVHAGEDLIGRLRPPPIEAVKGQVEAALRQARARHADTEPPVTDLLLVQAPRERQKALRTLLSDETQAGLAALRYAPIIVNWDRHDGQQALTDIRRTRRGCGDHALTLIRTDRGVVFDMSHIFFDALWGMGVAEIMTGFATALHPVVARARAANAPAVAPLSLAATPSFHAAAETDAAARPAEVAVETGAADLRALAGLRRRLAKIDLNLTVNDLLLLARCAHAAEYQPGMAAQQALAIIDDLEETARVGQRIRKHFDHQRDLNPALLIPMDASAIDPRLRLFPATFRNPLPTLLPQLQHCDALVQQLRRQPDVVTLHEFERERQALYIELRIFGELLRALKQVTMRGESFTTAALRLLGHLPGPVQNLVDMIPQKIGILNEILKGREVFSNVGQVASGSSITRFASARDDGETKLLVWGIMADTDGRLVITLRDFRPHVLALQRRGHVDEARALAQDYVDSYAESVNNLARRIQRVLAYKN